ncbi:alpha/beta fold hydrolase [Pseudobacter ginsenosidimutans]|jgi:pimeloyl-ACP methyl ester carboxylesterase|uniref:Pimeloyl-ACP methyl ester carboxylesterase n=1 Tax=Pseudobacter ginsenosidimutans TaxID=661488 RepID=A0A4Q7MMZ1_9BACT|nr:alpha/beta hydrolase [Pseudobacter ginsenosidimutans]QEC40473.1 alpha/beta hydrolase [Pseudobacter ginsenosidimutans]RZS68918.1 pimeloyl-ACP methyl ester carboxylesterase [Pseudobacter ginsenosidimutans]
MFIEKTIQIADQQWYYRKAGKGTAVVLVHGFAEDSQGWGLQQEFLQQHFTVIVPDLPGSGHSTATSTEWSMEMFADGIHAILEEEQIQTAIIIGHSMGGYISLAFAEKYPQQLLGLGLFHSTAMADSEERKNIRRRGIEFIQEHGAPKFLEQATPNLFAEETRQQNPQLVQQITDRYAGFSAQSLISYYEAMIRRPDRTALLQNISRPVLFVIGQYDATIPPDAVLPQTYLPSFSFVEILNHSGHMGMLEETARANQLLYRYCDACQTVVTDH